MRTCIFVDGENFRFSIRDLFPNFKREDYLPKSADWAGLFDWIVNEVTPTGERVRTYWYTIQSLDFFPYKFPSHESQHERLQRLLSKHPPYKDEFATIEKVEDRIRRMEEIVEAR